MILLLPPVVRTFIVTWRQSSCLTPTITMKLSTEPARRAALSSSGPLLRYVHCRCTHYVFLSFCVCVCVWGGGGVPRVLLCCYIQCTLIFNFTVATFFLYVPTVHRVYYLSVWETSCTLHLSPNCAQEMCYRSQSICNLPPVARLF